MKKLYTLSALLILLSVSIISQAQTTFWSEDFGTGCNRGQMANGVATFNGRWTVTQTGQNDAQANLWSGIYFLQLKSDSGSVVKRFVKE